MLSLRISAFWLLCAGLVAAPTDPPPFSLTDDAIPRRYAVELTLDPDRPAYQGVVKIDVELSKRLSVIWLNATGLKFSDAKVEANSKAVGARATPVGGEFVAVEMDVPIGPGHAAITLRYEAPLADKAVIGPYRLQYEDRWYIFTTFTPIGARGAFPCFDQPRYKTPWEFRIRVRGDLQAFANAAQVRETNEPGGMKVVEFAPTEPLPSEIVAFAVGPFDTLEGASAGKRQTRMRIITPRGHVAEGEDAARAAADILWRLEDYTALPYPYDKLDHIALPNLPFGAVENPGLITYRLQSLLHAPGKETPQQQRGVRGVESHEMAHQWFGDYVTQTFWEDVWLSEGFATWLSSKIMDQMQPPTRRRLAAAAARERIMNVDEGPKTRPIRLAMKDREALKDVYSQFVYAKAAAVLGMLEGWLGEESFRDGLRKYLKDHPFGNATTVDLAAALRVTSHVDPADVMHDFLDQTGVPAIRFEVHCEPGTTPRIVFEQANAAHQWNVPVCWRAGFNDGCTMVEARKQAELPGGSSCPAWVYPNANGNGYFRTEWSSSQVSSLVDHAMGLLTAAERLTLVNDVSRLRKAGKIEAATAEKVFKRLSTDSESEIAQAAKNALEPPK